MPTVAGLDPDRLAITSYHNPKSKFDSQYGIVSFHEWCKLEAKRFLADGIKTRITASPLAVAGGKHIRLERVEG